MTTVHITNAYHPASGGIRTFYHALLARRRRAIGGWCGWSCRETRDRVEDVNAFARIYVVRARAVRRSSTGATA